MKRTLLSVGCLAMLLVAGGVLAQGAKPKMAMPAKGAKAAMSLYLIESPHAPEECLKVMDEVKKSKDLAAWDWGCETGNHTGYRIVHAADENAALATVPEDVRAKAHAFKISKMTAAQLEAAHKQHGM